MDLQNHEGILNNRKIALTSLIWGVTVVSFFLSVFLIVLTIKSFDKGNVFPSNTITLVGEGEVVAIPDVASFNYTVNEISEDVSSAQKLASEKSNRILALLSDEGIEEKDIKTLSYNIYPKHEWKQPVCYPGQICRGGENVLIGYEVSHTVAVTIRDMSKAGEILAIIGSENVSNVSGISFKIDDEDILKADARSKAIEDAMNKADVLAKQLGVKIKKVVSFNEDYSSDSIMGYGGMEMRSEVMMLDKAVAPNLPTGEDTVKTRVYITFEIKG